MAEIRAAAERRAYRRVEEEEIVPALPEELEGALAVAAESRKSMSAIRAIAERRAGGLRSTPRGLTPRGGSSPRNATPTRTAEVDAARDDQILPIAPLPATAQPAKKSYEHEPLKC